eukprot:3481137-Lingulodinium_polyedra.AAC.1
MVVHMVVNIVANMVVNIVVNMVANTVASRTFCVANMVVHNLGARSVLRCEHGCVTNLVVN